MSVETSAPPRGRCRCVEADAASACYARPRTPPSPREMPRGAPSASRRPKACRGELAGAQRRGEQHRQPRRPIEARTRCLRRRRRNTRGGRVTSKYGQMFSRAVRILRGLAPSRRRAPRQRLCPRRRGAAERSRRAGGAASRARATRRASRRRAAARRARGATSAFRVARRFAPEDRRARRAKRAWSRPRRSVSQATLKARGGAPSRVRRWSRACASCVM